MVGGGLDCPAPGGTGENVPLQLPVICWPFMVTVHGTLWIELAVDPPDPPPVAGVGGVVPPPVEPPPVPVGAGMEPVASCRNREKPAFNVMSLCWTSPQNAALWIVGPQQSML